MTPILHEPPAFPRFIRARIDPYGTAEQNYLGWFPQQFSDASPEEFGEAIDWLRRLCARRWLGLKATALWAIEDRDGTGLTAISSREKFRMASQAMLNARTLRDVWIKAGEQSQ